jgi:hypothetical protein
MLPAKADMTRVIRQTQREGEETRMRGPQYHYQGLSTSTLDIRNAPKISRPIAGGTNVVTLTRRGCGSACVPPVT